MLVLLSMQTILYLVVITYQLYSMLLFFDSLSSPFMGLDDRFELLSYSRKPHGDTSELGGVH